MMRILQIVFGMGALVAFYFAYSAYSQTGVLETKVSSAASRLAQLQADVKLLDHLSPRPLITREEMLERFLTSLMDEAELLGSSVRLEVPKPSSRWKPVQYGIYKAPISLSSASETVHALGYYDVLWELIREKPVRFKKARVTINQSVSSLTLDLELFAL